MAQGNEWKPSPFKPEERAAIRTIVLTVKRLWNAEPGSKEENRAVDALIDSFEQLREFR